MIEIEESAITAIRQDLKILRDKVDRMESMIESIMDIYTDVFYTVREEYVKEIQSIESDGEFIEFSDFEDLRKSIKES